MDKAEERKNAAWKAVLDAKREGHKDWFDGVKPEPKEEEGKDKKKKKWSDSKHHIFK